VPESFARLHREFQEDSEATKLNPKLDAAPRVPGVLPRNELPSGTTTTEQSDLRDDVRRGGAQLRGRADEARATFDAKDSTSRSADGTLSTEKSLLLQTGRQVAADAGSTLDEARKAAGDLLKKKR
jgi:conjugal transfer mating pair stabilization protein TraG